jgi:hypothetical protein
MMAGVQASVDLASVDLASVEVIYGRDFLNFLILPDDFFNHTLSVQLLPALPVARAQALA